MKRKIEPVILGLIGAVVIGTCILLWWPQPISAPVSEKEQRIGEIMESDPFQAKARAEAEKIYYEELLNEGRQRLQELDEGGFNPQAGVQAALAVYLREKGAQELLPHVEEITGLHRWPEVVAIAVKETSLCRAGVGASRNNCGAIRSATGEFKRYATKFDALEDIASLLQKPRYAGKSISEMNGVYCVDEREPGNRCPGWDDHIEAEAAELRALASRS